MVKKSKIKLGGTIFFINEDDVIGIESYINAVKSYFVHSEDLEDIVADREKRIADILKRQNRTILNKKVG